jgi:hypothetical protein
MVQWGYGTTISYNSVTLELVSVGGPSMEQGTIETTHMGSTNRFREFIDALRDAGEVTITAHHDPQIDYNAELLKAGVQQLQITEPLFDSVNNSTKGTFQCQAMVTGYEPTRELEDRTTAEITFKLSGEPTLSTETT